MSVASPKPETKTHELNESRLGSPQALHPNLKQENTNPMKADWDLSRFTRTWKENISVPVVVESLTFQNKKFLYIFSTNQNLRLFKAFHNVS